MDPHELSDASLTMVVLLDIRGSVQRILELLEEEDDDEEEADEDDA